MQNVFLLVQVIKTTPKLKSYSNKISDFVINFWNYVDTEIYKTQNMVGHNRLYFKVSNKYRLHFTTITRSRFDFFQDHWYKNIDDKGKKKVEWKTRVKLQIKWWSLVLYGHVTSFLKKKNLRRSCETLIKHSIVYYLFVLQTFLVCQII